jgi:hypothetical protein
LFREEMVQMYIYSAKKGDNDCKVTETCMEDKNLGTTNNAWGQNELTQQDFDLVTDADQCPVCLSRISKHFTIESAGMGDEGGVQ